VYNDILLQLDLLRHHYHCHHFYYLCHKKGTKVHGDCKSIILESQIRAADGGYYREEMTFASIDKQDFILDVGHTHIAEAIGKPHGSSVHLEVTTEEPYGVCCMSGLKVI
jgi:hypothetical protein